VSHPALAQSYCYEHELHFMNLFCHIPQCPKLLLHTRTKLHVIYVSHTELLSINWAYNNITVQKEITLLRISDFR